MNLEVLKTRGVMVPEIESDDPARRGFWSGHKANLIQVFKITDRLLIERDALRRGDFWQNPTTGFLYPKRRGSRKVTQVEKSFCRPWEALGDLLHRLHWSEHRTIQEMGEILDVNESTIRAFWFKWIELEVRSPNKDKDPNSRINQVRRENLGWDNPEVVEKRMEGIEASWNDPKIAEYRLARMHSEEARKKRGESLRRWNEAKRRAEEEITEK